MGELSFSDILFKSQQTGTDTGKGNYLTPAVSVFFCGCLRENLSKQNIMNYFLAFFPLPKLSEVTGVFSKTFKSNFAEAVTENFS